MSQNESDSTIDIVVHSEAGDDGPLIVASPNVTDTLARVVGCLEDVIKRVAADELVVPDYVQSALDDGQACVAALRAADTPPGDANLAWLQAGRADAWRKVFDVVSKVSFTTWRELVKQLEGAREEQGCGP
jgi:hypothetical protein